MLSGIFSPAHRFLTQPEAELLAQRVKEQEARSDGEIRVYIESHCPTMDPTVRAKEIFTSLRMHQTTQRNAVMIYIAFRDHDFALLGDSGIFQQTPNTFWQQQAKQLAKHFHHKNHLDGLSLCIQAIGDLLQQHFPPSATPRNELPDEIVFGR
jgi:uncharacterized membrane protein